MQSLIPLPSAPTDNLYKFLALSGVALMIAGAGFPALALREYNDKGVEFLSERLVVESDKAAVKEELDSLHQEITGLRAEVKWASDTSVDAGLMLDKEYRAKVEKDNDYLLAQHNAVHARANDVDRRLAALHAKTMMIDMLHDDATRLKWLGAVFGALGAMLACFGFERWYSLYQKPQDDLILAELAERKARVAALASPSPPTPGPNPDAPPERKPETPASS